MRYIAALLLVLALPSLAAAQTVQKCVGRGGQARYQSEPCPRGMRTAEVWDAVPDPVAAPPSPERVAKARSHRVRARRARTVQQQVASFADACEQARAYRDEAERRAGLSRNYDLLSTLQRRVYDACR